MSHPLDIERFWSKVHKTDTCWLWLGATKGNGYGNIYFNGVYVYAHRISYEIIHGPIPEDMHVLHACDNTGCVNPEHLSVGTHQDNMNDAVSKGRLAKKLTKDEVEIIRKLSAEGNSQRFLAKSFGVSQPTIQKILSGKIWKDGS